MNEKPHVSRRSVCKGADWVKMPTSNIQGFIVEETSLHDFLSQGLVNEKSGVYLLIGEPDDCHRVPIYVGESENLSCRLKQHEKDSAKNYWDKACVFTCNDDFLSKSHIRYLESKLVETVKRKTFLELKNKHQNEYKSLSEFEKPSADRFYDNLLEMLPVMEVWYFRDSYFVPQPIDKETKRNGFPRYPEYKGSDVDWIDQIPLDWKECQLKHIVSLNDDVLPDSTPDDHSIEYVDIGSVDASIGIKRTERLTFENAPSRARRIVQNGDTIISTVRTYLKAIAHIENPNENLIVSTGFAVARPLTGVYPKFLGWLLRGEGFLGDVVSNSVGVSYPAITPSVLSSLKIVLPPFPEQQAIATFLDRETARIDGLIGKKVRLIKLLEEKRQAVISHAVTKGLNPNAPMKDSGIDWLGQIPEHWDVKPVKRLVSVKSGATPNKNIEEYWDGNVPWVSPKDMKTDFITTTIDKITEKALNETGIHLIPENSILMVVRGLILARTLPVGLTMCPVTINQDMKALFPKRDVSSGYLLYLLNALEGAFLAVTEESGHGTKALRTELWGNMPVCVPSHEEQAEIYEFIKHTNEKFYSSIQTVKDTINVLKEHRTSLISAAVTGKIDVRPKAEVIALSSRQKRNLVAAEIIRHMHADRTFGRTKAQKMFYLCEAYIGLSEFQGNYERYAAGPHDPKQMNSIAAELEDLQWYRQVEEINPETGSIRYSYQPLVNASEQFDLYEQTMLSEKKKIAHLITVARNWTTQQSEIIATLYAAWNDLLLDGKTVTDALVLFEVKNNWDEKKKRIPDYKWQAGFELMRKHNLIPTGKGPHTISQAGLF